VRSGVDRYNIVVIYAMYRYTLCGSNARPSRVRISSLIDRWKIVRFRPVGNRELGEITKKKSRRIFYFDKSFEQYTYIYMIIVVEKSIHMSVRFSHSNCLNEWNELNFFFFPSRVHDAFIAVWRNRSRSPRERGEGKGEFRYLLLLWNGYYF